MPDCRHFFCFKSQDEKTWNREEKKLRTCFKLLFDKADGERFGKYLNSPFFVDNELVGKLYDAIYERYMADDKRPIRIADLYNAYLKKYSAASRGGRLRKLLAMIPEHYPFYRSHAHLLDTPVETARMRTEAFQNSGFVDMYDRSCEDWLLVAKKLPFGLQRAYHQWASAHAMHFCFDRKKDQPSGSKFEVALERMGEFQSALNAFYSSEDFNISKMTNGEGVVLEAIVAKENPLLLCHDLLRKLLNSTGFDQLAYETFSETLLEVAPKLASEDRTAFFSHLNNYLTRIKRLGFTEVHARELVKWTEYLLDKQIVLDIPVVSKAFFLNRLQGGVMAQRPELMRGVIDLFAGHLPEEDTPGTMLHVEIALAFCQHEYEKVLALIEQTKWKSWKDTFADNYRLKSYRIRANLCLFARDGVAFEEVSVAIGDFEKHLSKSKTGIAFKRNEEIVIFLHFCRKISNSMVQYNFREYCDQLIAEMKEATYFHAQHWLIDFVKQADKRRRPVLDRIEPAYLPV